MIEGMALTNPSSQTRRNKECGNAWGAVAVIGGLIAADGIGSILVRSGQYHGTLFDVERGIRAGVGFALIALAISQMMRPDANEDT